MDTPPPPPQGSADVWVVVPAFREAQRIAKTLEQFRNQPYQVVVVDDGSDDGMSDAVQKHQQSVWLIRHAVNCGQGAAIQTGIDFALSHGAKTIVTFDGDGQHSVDDIECLIEPVQQREADVALGSRFLGKTVDMPAARGLLLKAAVIFTRIISRIRVTDTHNGLRAFSRDAATQIRIHQNRMAHASEILDEIGRLKLRYVEVPVTVSYAADTLEKGQSGWNAFKIIADLLLSKVTR